MPRTANRSQLRSQLTVSSLATCVAPCRAASSRQWSLCSGVAECPRLRFVPSQPEQSVVIRGRPWCSRRTRDANTFPRFLLPVWEKVFRISESRVPAQISNALPAITTRPTGNKLKYLVDGLALLSRSKFDPGKQQLIDGCQSPSVGLGLCFLRPGHCATSILKDHGRELASR